VGDVIQFKKKSTKDRHKGHTLCKSGFHKWEISGKKQFDVKQGKLVTLSICARCGETKTELK
jgi:ribosomal protein L32